MLATSLLREQRSNCTRVDRDFRAPYVTRTPPARFTYIRTINLGYGSEMGTESKERGGNSFCRGRCSWTRLVEAACTKLRNPPRTRRFCGPESTLDTLQGALGASRNRRTSISKLGASPRANRVPPGALVTL